MRIAYVSSDPGVPVFGRKGASIHVQEVVRAMLARGDDVDLLTARIGGPTPQGLEAVRVHELPAPPRGGTSADREVAAKRAGQAAGPVLDRQPVDGAPIDIVYERYSLWGSSAMRWARTAGRPGVLEVNAPLPDEQACHRVLHDRRAADRVAAEVLRAASSVVAVSAPVAEWAATVGGRPDAVHVVANGVDVDRFRPRSGEVLTGATCTIGFVGTLKAWHGITTLAEAFTRLAAIDPCYRLLIVGDGPERTELEARLATSGLSSRVELLGAVDPAAVPTVLQRVDIAVAPYPANAGYFSPLKLYEYLAAGLPVVASAVGQVADVLDDGRTGLLCRPGDPRDLATAIDALRADPPWAARLGRAGRTLVEQHHTWHAVVERILALAGSPAQVGAS